MGLASSRHQQQSQNYLRNPQPPATSSGGGDGNSGDDGPSKYVDESKTVLYRFEVSALERAAPKKSEKYFEKTNKDTTSSWKKTLMVGIGSLSLVALAIHKSKGSTGIIGRYIQARSYKPVLARETSRLPPLSLIRHPVKTVQKLLKKPSSADIPPILPHELQEQLLINAKDAENMKKSKSILKMKMVVHGPPNTGKTMAARMFAEKAGFDYVICSGHHIKSLGKEAVAAIEHLFDWAETSKKGLLIFVDEADVFLENKLSKHTSEHHKDIQRAFVRRACEDSKKFMVVLALTAQPLRWPLEFEADHILKFQLPGVEERKCILLSTVKNYIRRFPPEDDKLPDAATLYDEALYWELAKMSEGLSGRELKVIGWYIAGCASGETDFKEMAISKCQHVVREHWLGSSKMKEKVQQPSTPDEQESKSISTELKSSRVLKIGKLERPVVAI